MSEGERERGEGEVRDGGAEEKRKRETVKERQGTWRRRTTRRDVYDSGALLLRSMCQCASRWRPAEVDGLALGRRRRRSVALGTRSVMESLAAPSVEAMTPSTPLLPPNARRFPSVAPLGVSAAAARCPTTRDVTAAPRYHPSDRPLPCPIALLLNLIVTPAYQREEKSGRKKEREGGMENHRCRRHQHRAPLTVVPRAALRECMLPSEFALLQSF